MVAPAFKTQLLSVVRALVVSVSFVLVVCGVARAQGPVYVAAPPSAGASYRDGQGGRYLLGGSWLFRADPSDVGLGAGWWRDVAATDGWSLSGVPGAFNAGDFSAVSMAGSVGWYRRDFVVPAGAFGRWVAAGARRWVVRFELVNYRAGVWLNGRYVGGHVGEGGGFEFDLRGVRAGVNRLVVRVDSRRLAGDLPPGAGAGWWNYGGILGEVYLRAVAGVDLSRALITPSLACGRCAATVDERVVVRNLTGGWERVRLTGSFGATRVDFGGARVPPHGTWTPEALVAVAHPRLWSIDRPVLYRAALTLTDTNGRRLGSYLTYTGIRTVTVTADGRLELNGRVLHLRGVEVRQQDLTLGAALDPAHVGRLIGWVKQLGATLIRTDPLNPQLLELADRNGILIWSDIAVNQQVGNNYLSQPVWLANAHALLSTNILANENHPSVLVWSIGNELPTPPTFAEASYIAGAAALAHSVDPTRPVGMSISDWPGVPCQGAYAPLDVIGINEYFGWFDAGGGTTDDRDALGPFLDSLRACYPNKALFVTEFGFDGNRNGPVEERGTYQFQADAAAYHLGVYASKPWLAGASYFLLQDAATSPNYGGGNPWPDPPFNRKGLIDLLGNAKPAFATVASAFKAVAQISPPPSARRARPGR
jgi:Glycosyl hydrolases family 2, TIM barrel domain/Glycosyl hydrolases family 2, sugar binding domain/Glycosyl hydrolases family 2